MLDGDALCTGTIEERREALRIEQMDGLGIVIGLRRNRRDDETLCDAHDLACSSRRIGHVLEHLEERDDIEALVGETELRRIHLGGRELREPTTSGSIEIGSAPLI